MKPLYAVTLALSLAACGGGGSSPPPVVAPPVAPPGLQSTAVTWKLPTPIGWQQLFGLNALLAVKGNVFSFNVPTYPNHINYVVNSPMATPLTGYKSITISYGITQTPNAAYTFVFDSSNTCGGPPKLTPYFQQKGDNGNEDTYRWWSHTRLVFQPGKNTVTIPLDPTQWGSVFGHTASTVMAGWNAALANTLAIGLTFGGGCFDGHGLAMTKGASTFSLISYTLNK